MAFTPFTKKDNPTTADNFVIGKKDMQTAAKAVKKMSKEEKMKKMQQAEKLSK